MQCATIEFARNVLGLEEANSTEFDKTTRHPVICLMDEQRNISEKGGTMRLGSYPCILEPGSLAHQAYGEREIEERHRHRYEVNHQYRGQFAAHGLVATGLSPDEKLVEIMELRKHPWFLAVQYHPEFKSKPTKAQPLFREFVRASFQRRETRKSDHARPRVEKAAV
jgi:CTP synthase